jgi:hypothetical protein
VSLLSSVSGFREALNRRPAIGLSLAGLVIVIVAVIIVAQVRGCGGGGAAGGGDLTKAYFATEDGKTPVVGDATQVPPFDQNGQTLYRAVVYRCKNKPGDLIVAYLEKYPPDVKQQMQQARTGDAIATLTAFQHFASKKQVKRPGDKDWVSLTAKPEDQRKFHEVMAPPKVPGCPPEDLEVVLP